MYLHYSTWKIVVKTCFNYIYQFLRVAITKYNKLGGLHHKNFSILNFLKNCYNAFHSGCTTYIPTNSAQGFSFLHILTNTCYF